MQQSTTLAPNPAAPSFAGLMAALAAPVQKSAAAPWTDDDLADDIATLSYESALKAHARYRSADYSVAQADTPNAEDFEDKSPTASATFSQAPAAKPNLNRNSRPVANHESEADCLPAAHFQQNLKDASITIRMSKAECEQLHRRAAEAGLTVSAYLRSCTFEAESLRAMVKDTLAQLRSAKTQAKPVPSSRSWFREAADWLSRLLPNWQGNQRVARA
jgi:predicted DNA binding CopG/RHH family protein